MTLKADLRSRIPGFLYNKVNPQRVQGSNNEQRREVVQPLNGLLLSLPSHLWSFLTTLLVPLPSLPQLNDTTVDIIVRQDVGHAKADGSALLAKPAVQDGVFER
jgi:hypothetical protein